MTGKTPGVLPAAMHTVTRRVARTVRRRRLLSAGDRVAVAVSGGSDSVALAWLVHELAAERRWVPVGLLHVNHLLRGDASDADDAFCRALAERIGWPFESVRVDVAAMARDRGCSIEVAARDARYAFFDEAAERVDAGVVATGHTMDDQAETVLMRLLEGAGTRGLSGIRPRRGRVVRPLIDCRRSELRTYLIDRAEPFREDLTNLDTSVPRNRIRRDLMPVVETVAPGGVTALARFAELAAADESVLEQAAIQKMPTVVLSKRRAGVELNTSVLAGLPPALGRRVVRLAVAGFAPGARLSARHLEAVRLLAAAERTGGHLDLPGLTVDRSGAALVIDGSAPHAVEAVAFEYRLEVPGTIDVPEAGVTMTASRSRDVTTKGLEAAGSRVAVQESEIAAPLTVRNRRPGDRFRPLGAPGRRKLQDLLVDRKIPRDERGRVPVVVDQSGQVVWVAGVAVSDACRVRSPEAGVVVLEMRKNP